MTAPTNTSEFRARVADAMSAGIITGDGHSLYRPEFYAPYFTAAELASAGLIREHASDGTHKGSIFGPDGSVVETLEAVYNLSFLYWVCRTLGETRYPRAEGRGSQAQELVEFIVENLAQHAGD